MDQTASAAKTRNPNQVPRQESPPASRRTSGAMGPPPLPHQGSLPNSPRPSTTTMMADHTAFNSGPIRHPRPLTAAELHLELEKEQESIVNRLTRELSALRAQTASVASTASSASDLFSSQNLSEYTHPYSYQIGAGANIIPTSARRHRSSSNLSARSARSARDATTSASVARDATATSVSGVAAPRDLHQVSSRPSIEISRGDRPDMSRQNSMSGYRSTSSAATSPYLLQSPTNQQQHASANHSHNHNYHWSQPQPHRTSLGSLSGPNATGTATGGGNGSETKAPTFSPTSLAHAKSEEAVAQRAEVDALKRENEVLKSRINELEKLFSQHVVATPTPGSTPGTLSTSAHAAAAALSSSTS